MLTTTLICLACFGEAPAPPPLPDVAIEDLERFTWDLASAQRQLDLARAHLAWLDAVSSLGDHEQQRHAAWRQEAAELLACWEAMTATRQDWYGDCYPLERLEALRDLIGPEAYYRGEMPPAVPYWRFELLP